MMDPISITIWLGVATASIAYTVAKAPFFEPVKDRLPAWLRAPLDCAYCASHWIAAALVAAFRPMPFLGWWLDLVPVVFIVVTLAALIVLVMGLMMAIEGALREGE